MNIAWLSIVFTKEAFGLITADQIIITLSNQARFDEVDLPRRNRKFSDGCQPVFSSIYLYESCSSLVQSIIFLCVSAFIFSTLLTYPTLKLILTTFFRKTKLA